VNDIIQKTGYLPQVWMGRVDGWFSVGAQTPRTWKAARRARQRASSEAHAVYGRTMTRNR
jgi:hypothetical protein